MRIEFITTDYVFAHGKSPRGRGAWAFSFGARSAAPLFFPSCTYAEARRAAAIVAIGLGVSQVWVCS